MKVAIEELKLDGRGLIPVVVQDARTREALTLAYMNAESIGRTLATGETWFWSRSRSALWHKGETSGHTQRVVDVLVDCDRDALVVLVEPAGPACHTGERSCFHQELEGAGGGGSVPPAVAGGTDPDTQSEAALGPVLHQLYAVVESRRRERPEGSYTAYLFERGLDKILKKLGEEASETIIAAKNEDPVALTKEASDLLYHLVVLLVERGVTLGDLGDELKRRRGE